ncbi:MAG: hypothetical protein MK066_08755 [Crocinitomicaceae bacterium]|nr:hypothetical protein [Crocinitomicaceae bacterium]
MLKIKIATTVIFLLCSRYSFSQDYYEYYEGVNKAKLSLIEDSLEKGVKHYFETFEKFDFVFARDCFNALEVASKIGNFDKIDCFFRRCLIQGIEFSFLEQKSILTDFKNTSAWPEILLVKDSLRSIYENNVNWEIRDEINTIFAKDQAIRDLTDKNRFNIFRIRKLNKQFEEVDRKLVLRMIQITKEYGFPGEKLIGLDTDSMHQKMNHRNLTAGMPIVVFIHHYSQPNKSHNSLLIDEVKKGNISNEHYATISDFQYTYGKEKDRDELCYSLMFIPELDSEIIDDNRSKINLLSISRTSELQRKKLITFKYYLY